MMHADLRNSKIPPKINISASLLRPLHFAMQAESLAVDPFKLFLNNQVQLMKKTRAAVNQPGRNANTAELAIKIFV